MTDSQLADAVARLPERYQPIYGFDDEQSSARSADLPRTSAIMDVIDLVAAAVGRPLRILDLGSAQGYYGFLAAERGHAVTGVENLPQNLEVARLVAARHPDLTVEFVAADVAAVAGDVAEDDFDLVLGLSILHHVAHRDGHDRVVAIVDRLQRCIPFGIFEMALDAEPLYWAASLPSDPRQTLAPYRFVRELAWSSTHLSDLPRPVLFCSSTHVLVDGALHPIGRYSESSHAGAAAIQAGLRRYVEYDGSIVKLIARFGTSDQDALLASMREELRHEAEVLAELSAASGDHGLDIPRVVEFSESPTETLLARTCLPGRIVSECGGLSASERETIVEQVLEQLVAFESIGWYHTDLRSWNVVWDADTGTARLIDHGALRHEPGDLAWPHSAHYSFVLLADAVLTGTPDQIGLESPRALRRLPAEVGGRAGAVLQRALLRPATPTWFADTLADWRAATDEAGAAPIALHIAAAHAQLDEQDYGARKAALTAVSRSNRQHRAERDALLAERAELWAERDSLYETIDRLSTTIESLVSERDGLYVQRDSLYAERDGLYGERQALYDERQGLYDERQALYDERVALYSQLSRLTGGQG